MLFQATFCYLSSRGGFNSVADGGTTPASEILPSTVFMAFALLSMVRFPLAFFPFIIMQWINLKVSFKRVQAYLTCHEYAPL